MLDTQGVIELVPLDSGHGRLRYRGYIARVMRMQMFVFLEMVLQHQKISA